MAKLPDDLVQTRWSLIRRLKDLCDDDAWQEFFDAYWRLIYSVASHSGLTHVEAEEVVQETILSVCRKIATFRADPAAGSFKSWLLQLTRWRIGDQFRKRGRLEALRHHKSAKSEGAADPTTATEERVPDPAGSLIEAVWSEEWQQNVREAALEKLKTRVKPKHYQIFYLLTVKGLAPAEVAQTLRVTRAQVYVVRYRLARLFDKALKEAEARML